MKLGEMISNTRTYAINLWKASLFYSEDSEHKHSSLEANCVFPKLDFLTSHFRDRERTLSKTEIHYLHYYFVLASDETSYKFE